MGKNIILVANSPGELSALVKPVAENLARYKSLHTTLIITPCQYQSGKEIEFAKNLKGIHEIISSAEYKKWFLRKTKYSPKGAVLFLGGDLLHAVLIARKLKYPAFAYLNERIAWKNFFRKFFVADEESYLKFSKKVPKEKLQIVGNLMVDSVANLKKWSPENKVISFMPGSRRWEIEYMTPFYQEVMNLIHKEDKKVKFQIVSSSFVKAKAVEGAKIIDFENVHNSELVITIPGTNTAKLAARGIPMIMVFPLNHPEAIPLEGLADLIGKMPVMGKPFKKYLAEFINKKTRFFALPNQKANREIIPEIRGEVEPLSVALKTLLLLNDFSKREQMSKELIEVMGHPGAAEKICETIINL